jgi:hypothetical protein
MERGVTKEPFFVTVGPDELDDHHHFHFAQVKTMFEPQIAKLFQERHSPTLKLGLTQVKLLENQCTIDFLCNEALVIEVFKSNKCMRLKCSGCTMSMPSRQR